MTFLAWLVVIAMPVVANAHGGEHAGMRAAGAATALNVDGYRVEMSSHPSPLARGAPGHLVATVRHADSGQPLSGGRVLIGLSPLGVTPDLQVASEDTWAGSYAVAITPARLGAHQARVILEGLEGRASQAPLVLDFLLGVERPPGLGGPVWVLFGAVVVIGLGTAYAVVHRARLGRTDEPRLDLLTVPWIRRILTVVYLGLIESILLLGGALVVGPLLVLGGAALTNRLAGTPTSLRRTFVLFGYVLVPVGLAMHLAHNLAHLLLEGGGIIPVTQRVIALYTPFSVGVADWRVMPLAPQAVVSLLQVAIVVAFFGLSLVAGHRLTLRTYPDARSASRAFLPMAAIVLGFTLVGLVVLSLPMGMRHGS